jgi:hypothetical protein
MLGGTSKPAVMSARLIRQTKVRIPPTVAVLASLFRKAYVDTMFMPHASGYRYIVQDPAPSPHWPEWRALRIEMRRTLGAFLFEEILCRWGAVEEIVTDNGTGLCCHARPSRMMLRHPARTDLGLQLASEQHRRRTARIHRQSLRRERLKSGLQSRPMRFGLTDAQVHGSLPVLHGAWR